jgi:3-isopropylmalate/(R)-2-methylmalate dehydratase small subunit
MAIIEGRIHKLGEDVDTDQIIPAMRCHTSNERELAQWVFENLDPSLRERIGPGDIIFAGENFGGGSAREQAPLAIKGANIACVVAESFARTFYRNSINVGLPILVAPAAARAARTGDAVTIDLERGTIQIGGETFPSEGFPPFVRELIAQGGLVNYVRERLRSTSRQDG